VSKTKKRILLYSSVVVLALVVATAWFVVSLESSAQALAETGTGTIQMLNEVAAGVGALDADAILAVYDDSYAGETPGAWKEHLESEREGVKVYRWAAHEGDAEGGRPAMRRQLDSYLSTLRSVEQSKFKLDLVEQIPSAGEAQIRSTLWIRGTHQSGEAFESHAHFRMSIRKAGSGWKITGQTLLRGDTVSGDRRGFTNVAAASGLDFHSQHNPLFSTPEWDPKQFGIIKYGAGGASAADYDGDGWYDLLFLDTKKVRLYHNNGDGTFTDATTQAGFPEELGSASVGIFADLDNDGDKDLFVGRFTAANMLFRNDGDGTFTDVTEGAGIDGYFVTTAAAADYDGDSLPDIYAGRYLDPRTKSPTTMFYTRNGEGNLLLRNKGGLRFEDVTADAGVREGGLTLGVVWADYDEDGDQDLYVANDFGRNALFNNQGDGTFADVSLESGAIDFGFGMSADFGDVDNDGDLDLYVSNVHSSQRWYGQSATLYKYLLTSVRLGTLVDDLPTYRETFGLLGADWESIGDKMVKGNSLLLNDGTGHFEDAAERAGANPFGWYWGSAFADFDNDGRQDIYANNGWITAKSHDDF
jgi:hypothetical protein